MQRNRSMYPYGYVLCLYQLPEFFKDHLIASFIVEWICDGDAGLISKLLLSNIMCYIDDYYSIF